MPMFFDDETTETEIATEKTEAISVGKSLDTVDFCLSFVLFFLYFLFRQIGP
jgi:hypothetical protein